MDENSRLTRWMFQWINGWINGCFNGRKFRSGLAHFETFFAKPPGLLATMVSRTMICNDSTIWALDLMWGGGIEGWIPFQRSAAVGACARYRRRVKHYDDQSHLDESKNLDSLLDRNIL